MVVSSIPLALFVNVFLYTQSFSGLARLALLGLLGRPYRKGGPTQ